MQKLFKELKYLLLLLFLIAVAACSPTVTSPATPTPQAAPVQEQAEESREVDAEPVQPPAAEEEIIVEAKPTPKQGLMASDPTTVALASGEPVLVEFFAFW
ncbi:MAG: hypothetical protein P1P76_08470 [Anaerolineales bacterium]|nr:hypothetical protein [Anaerolineales bacterium]